MFLVELIVSLFLDLISMPARRNAAVSVLLFMIKLVVVAVSQFCGFI